MNTEPVNPISSNLDVSFFDANLVTQLIDRITNLEDNLADLGKQLLKLGLIDDDYHKVLQRIMSQHKDGMIGPHLPVTRVDIINLALPKLKSALESSPDNEDIKCLCDQLSEIRTINAAIHGESLRKTLDEVKGNLGDTLHSK